VVLAVVSGLVVAAAGSAVLLRTSWPEILGALF
jgi:hypothetical protein